MSLILPAFLFFLLSNSSIAQVVINEAYVRPRGNVNMPAAGNNGLIYINSEEYIELYNKGCTPVDVSGYFIAMKQVFGTAVIGGTLRIPNSAAAIIPPGGHLILGSAQPPNPGILLGNVDITFSNAAGDYCLYPSGSVNSNLALPNSDGWVALYNTTGNPLDCIYWSGAANNIINNPDDFDTGPICLPAATPTSPSVTLQDARDIYNTKSCIVSYIPITNPILIYRQTDGAPTWNFVSTYNAATLPSTINKSVVGGRCNGGTCLTPSQSAPSIGAVTNVSTCGGTGSVVLNNLPGNLSNGVAPCSNWTVTQSPGGNTTTGNTTSTTITGLAQGNYTFTVTNVGGCVSTASANVTITGPTNCCPTITNPNTVAAICPGADLPPVSVSTTTTGADAIRFVYFNTQQTVASTIYAGPNTLGTATPASGTATYDGSNLGLAGSLPNTPGTYYIYAILNPAPTDVTCRPFQEIVITISSLPATPTASVTVQPTCTTPTGTIVITAPTGPNFEYSTNGTTYQAGTTFTSLAPNSYNVTVRNTTTGCVSAPLALTVNPIPGAPAAPTASVTVQPTCTTPTGTIVITAPTGANFEYSINGTTYQAGTTFTTLAPNSYNVTVRNTTTGCISAPTALTVNAVPAPPAAPTASVTVQPTCTTPTGTIVITAPTGANLEYSINGTTYQAGTTFTTLSPNNYNVTVRNTTTGCISSPTALTVDPVPAPPAAPTASVTSQPTCTTPTGTITVTAPTGANLEYSINGTTYQASTTFNTVVPNSYSVTVRNTATGCISSASPLTVNAAPGTPATPTASVTVQPTCTTPTGTIVVSSPTGANLEYSINGSPYQTSTTFSSLAPNTSFTVTVRNTTSGCTAVSAAIPVNPIPAPPAAPTASVTIQPTCTTPTGTIVITAPTGANFEYSINGTTYQAGTTFSTLTPNTYNVTVRNTSNGCVSAPTALTVDPVPAPPVAPVLSVTQPNCTTPTGIITITNPTGANLEYSVNGTSYQANATFSGLVPNTYNVTVRNTATGCVSSATNQTINVAPGTPATPVANVTVQPTCITPTGTIVVSTPSGANLEYSIDGVTYQPSLTFTGVVPGNYTITVRNTLAGCVSAPTPITVNNIPAAPNTPTASVTIQPTCLAPTGTIVITAPTGANLEYSIDGTTYAGTTTFSNLSPNAYSVTVRNTATGCVSSPASLTVNPVPSAPATPTASVTVQPTCITTTGTIVITAPTGTNLEYSINGTSYQSSLTFSALTPNSYNVTVRNTVTGCVSSPTSLTVNPIPGAPPAPTVGIINPTCSAPLTGNITVTNPLGAGFQYSINGVNYQVNPLFAGLVPNTYNVTVRETATGCTSSVTIATVLQPPPVSPRPTAPQQPEYCVGAVPSGPFAASGINLLWYTNPTGGTGSPTAPTPNTSSPGQKIVYVTQTITNGCESERLPVIVEVNALPIVSAGPDRRINIGESVVLQGTALGNNVNILWSPSATLVNANTARPTATPRVNTPYTITVVTADGCVGTDNVNVVVIEPINIPNIFSPNGDGFNDLWIIDKIEQYPNAVVEIFNRYGKKIFERKGYSRSSAWDGTNKGAALPVGAYYYILRLGDDSQPRAGVISIIR